MWLEKSKPVMAGMGDGFSANAGWRRKEQEGVDESGYYMLVESGVPGV